MSSQRIQVHFSPDIIARIGPEVAPWAEAMRSWHHEEDPDRIFGRDVFNSADGFSFTWARHLHMSPDEDVVGQVEVDRWDRVADPYRRVSDRLIVYSLDKADPLKYGLLMLALLGDPGGHERLIKGAAAAQHREDWERFAYTHQTTGELPPGSESS